MASEVRGRSKKKLDALQTTLFCMMANLVLSYHDV
jgi:hypothetical protein